jgi:hypothetical protein
MTAENVSVWEVAKVGYRVSSVDELVEIISKIVITPFDQVWRGQADSKWNITSGLQRCLFKGGSTYLQRIFQRSLNGRCEIDLQAVENKILSGFRGWRIIDESANKGSIQKIPLPITHNTFKEAIRASESEVAPRFLYDHLDFPRYRQQKGAMLWGSVNRVDSGSDLIDAFPIKDIEVFDGNNMNLCFDGAFYLVLIVPSEIKQKIGDLLNRHFGNNRSSLFPDISGFVDCWKERFDD